MELQEAAQRVADVINEIRTAGFNVDMGDWPECKVSIYPADATFATVRILEVVHRDDTWVVRDGT